MTWALRDNYRCAGWRLGILSQEELPVGASDTDLFAACSPGVVLPGDWNLFSLLGQFNQRLPSTQTDCQHLKGKKQRFLGKLQYS